MIQHSAEDPSLVTETPVDVANRASTTYRFLATQPMDPGDFLRVRVDEDSQVNGIPATPVNITIPGDDSRNC